MLKETDEPVGSVGIMFGDSVHSADMQEGDAEIGYWIGVPIGKGVDSWGRQSPVEALFWGTGSKTSVVWLLWREYQISPSNG